MYEQRLTFSLWPHQVYDHIFEKDPLLLSAHSQRLFGIAITDHMLQTRTAKQAEHIEYYLPSFHENHSRIFPSPDPRSSIDLNFASKYKSAKYHRSTVGVTEAVISHLKKHTTVSKLERTANRGHPDGISARTSSGTPSPSFLVAAIGHRIGISRVAETDHLDEELRIYEHDVEATYPGESPNDLPRNKRSVPSSNSATIESWQQEFIESLTYAVEDGAHIIFSPEFSLPPDTDTWNAKDEIRSVLARNDYEGFVFSGSRHEGPYNRGLIFGNSSKSKWHYKETSARRLGENILAGPNFKIPIYVQTVEVQDELQRVKILTPICYDTFDVSTFQFLTTNILRARDDGEFGIIIVPSFNPSLDFIALLRDLSFLSRSVVLYNDSLNGEAIGFVCGFAIKDFFNADSRVNMRRALQNKLRKIEEEIEEITEEVEIEEKLFKGYLSNETEQRKGSKDELENQRNAVREFLTIFEPAYDSKYEAMVTIASDCDPAGESTRDDTICRNVLLYELDFEFIKSIVNFRNAYFVDSAFLPDSLVWENFAAKKQNSSPIAEFGSDSAVVRIPPTDAE